MIVVIISNTKIYLISISFYIILYLLINLLKNNLYKNILYIILIIYLFDLIINIINNIIPNEYSLSKTFQRNIKYLKKMSLYKKEIL